ncbi:MAG TPA: DUF4349 domain-containing protein [Phycisphaerales bacterium]|nr:DUF4349 domain-containing protein [Phycisphaerales bacterium]
MSIDQSSLEATLTSMTAWNDPAQGVWQTALAATRPVRRQRLSRPSKLVSVLAVLVLVGLAVGIMLPSLGKARSSRRVASEMSVASGPPPAAKTAARARGGESTNYAMAGGPPPPASAAPASPPPPPQPAIDAPADRMVIRKATVELKTPDVRAAFAKAAQVTSEAQGEYIESSSLTGEGDEMQATMTLRVAATRLSTVLNQLRGLAEVTSENSTGEDITDQFVDLDARLRNEQRIETELLELLASRKDAPLREVLELRDSISRVRESIERMTAQRERLSRLVSLATVLVIIRPDSTKPPPIPDGLGRYFVKQLRSAWQGSLTFLADSIALLVHIIIGGAVFWIAGALILAAILTARRRATRRLGQEPAPSL